VVIARSNGPEVRETMESDRILGSRVPKGSRELADAALGDIVARLATDEEAIATGHSIGSDCGTIKDVEKGARVDTRLLVGETELNRFCVLLGVESRGRFDLEALGNLVLELELGAEDVGGRPSLGEGKAVSFVGVFTLEVALDVGGF